MKRSVVVLALAFGACLITASVSPASYEPTPTSALEGSNIDQSLRVVEGLGSYDIPGTPAAPGSAGIGASWSDEALEEIQRLPETPTATSADAIASQGSRVARIAKYAPELWRYGKFAMGGIGGFVLTIGGEYLIAKIFSPADTPAGQIWDLNGFRLMDAGETILRSCATMDCSGTPTAVEINRPSRVFETSSNRQDFFFCTGGSDRNSPSAVLGGIPEGASVVTTYFEPTIHGGTCGEYGWQHFSVIDPIDPSEFAPWGITPGSQVGTLDLTPCTVVWPCDNSPHQQEIEDALNSGTAPQLAQELDHFADPAHEVDPNVPETENPNNHRCDVGVPWYENPSDNSDPPPATIKDSVPFETPVRPSGATGEPEPLLRWGSTTWAGGTLDNWPGWGWRHIVAKHGWSSADREATRAALASPTATAPRSPTRMVYYGEEYQRNRAWCMRAVVVEWGEVEPGAPLGILTSYGEYQREVP